MNLVVEEIDVDSGLVGGNELLDFTRESQPKCWHHENARNAFGSQHVGGRFVCARSRKTDVAASGSSAEMTSAQHARAGAEIDRFGEARLKNGYPGC